MAKEKREVIPNSQATRVIPQGRLLIIGGKEDKGDTPGREREHNVNFISEQILKRFVDELKGEDPLVVVIPTASRIPEETAQDYLDVFQSLEAKNVQVADIRTRQDANQPEYVELVKKAAGIMFTGGDQLRLTAMSTPMIYEGESEGGYIKGDVRVTTGLEFLKNVAIDTHFLTRGRIVRLTQAICTNPECIGIGLEEDTAIFLTQGGNVEVVGSGLVTVVDGMGITETNIYDIGNGEPFTAKGLRMHMLANGDDYVVPSYKRFQLQ